MRGYYEECRELPIPSEEQIRDFVDYVACAHSWYKHLPLVPPGRPFYLFLDPNSGCDCVMASLNSRYRERKEQGFHYSAIPTADYRRGFGHLEYSVSAGTTILAPDPEGVVPSTRVTPEVSARKGFWRQIAGWLPFRSEESLGDLFPRKEKLGDLVAAVRKAQASKPRILTREGQWVDVPQEILDAGRVEITGVVHREASTDWLWRWWWWRRDPRTSPSARRWPEETGGPNVLLKILEIVETKPFEEDFVEGIHVLVEPERQRQKRLMQGAIRRVIKLLHKRPTLAP